jgi:ribosomal protein S1
VGDELTLMVIRVDPNERRIGLSLKDLAAAISLEEPTQADARGRGKGRKRRGGEDFDEDEE